MTDPAPIPVLTRDSLHVMARSGTWPEGWEVVALADENTLPPVPLALPAVVVAHDLACADADLHLTPDTLTPIKHMIATRHGPSLALVQLLRMTANLPVDLALTAESLAYAALQGSRDFTAWLQGQRRKSAPRGEEAVLIHHAHAGHDHLILNRPARANMINMALRQDLVAALGALALGGKDRPILLTGAGKWFCAGGDVHEFGLVSSPDMGHVLRQRVNLPAAVARVADRLHVHLHGAVIGAGIELAAFARKVTAHPDTTFRLPELTMGLIPGCGGTVSIPRRIGRQRCAAWCLSDMTLDAATALDWGLIDGICVKPPPAPEL